MKLVIANRGEIARRILRTAERRGYRVAVISTAEDSDALVRSEADDVLEVASFLDARAIVEAAKAYGAHLLHPGYGFLSENADFAALVESEGIAFVGPDPVSMRAGGDKESAKALAAACDVPTLAAVFSEELKGLDESQLAHSLKKKKIQPPFLVKAVGGGGGRGMRVVTALSELPEALERASEEAEAGFDDPRVFVERLLERSRHVEIQLFGDGAGGGVALGERECSIQRRHQKVFEESPSPNVGSELRQSMGKAALRIVSKSRYRGAGTAEFLLDESSDFYFLEMNTRLQVEHPVTEQVFGIDLVDAQFELAEGRWPESLPEPAEQVVLEPQGWSMEARVLAEDPRQGFVPTPGPLLVYREPKGEGIRVDSGVGEGSRVNRSFDSMIAKLISTGKDRAEAIDRMQKALDETVILGTTTNLPLLRSLVRHPDFRVGKTSTDWLSDELERLNRPRIPDGMRARLTSPGFLTALSRRLSRGNTEAELPPLAQRFHSVGNRVHRVGSRIEVGPVEILGPMADGSFELSGSGLVDAISRSDDREPKANASDGEKWRYELELRHLMARSEPQNTRASKASSPSYVFWAAASLPDEIQFQIFGECFRQKDPRRNPRLRVAKNADGQVMAPMAGKVLEVRVAKGDEVVAGDVLFVVESMKMQLEVKAPLDGAVEFVHVEEEQVLDGPDLMAVISK